MRYNKYNAGASSAHLPLNVLKGEQGYRYEFLMPGYDRAAIEVNVEQDKLMIQSKLQEQEATKGSYSQRQFRTKDFKKQFSLPEDVDLNAVKAQMQSGLLIVDLPFDTSKHIVRQINVN
jgi:HSP20 family protein